jgi:hypothetical protein
MHCCAHCARVMLKMYRKVAPKFPAAVRQHPVQPVTGSTNRANVSPKFGDTASTLELARHWFAVHTKGSIDGAGVTPNVGAEVVGAVLGAGVGAIVGPTATNDVRWVHSHPPLTNLQPSPSHACVALS